MKNTLLLFLFLIPIFLFAQYPTGSNKSRLGWQTTGDGLIWRGVAGDTVNKPNSRNYPYFQLDTVNAVLYRYIQTRGKWQPVSENIDIDSLIYATRFWVNSNFFPLQGGTLTGTGGNGFVGFPLQSSTPATPATGFSLYAGSTGNNISWMQPDGFFRRLVSPVTGTPRQYQFMARSYTLADSADVASNITSIAANYIATSNGTNLVARNLFDNNTYVGILNNKPFQFGQWTTAGRPAGTNGYTGFNTSFNWLDIYSSSGWFSPARSATTGGAFTSGYIPFGGTGGLTESSGFYRQNNYFWNVYDVDYSGFFFGETTSKYGGIYWRNVLEELHITSTPATAPIQIGLNAGIRLLGDDDFLLRDSSIYVNRSATGGKFLINSTQILNRYEFLFKATKGSSFGVIGDYDYVGFDIGESASKTAGVFWRNALERLEIATRDYLYPIVFGNNWLYMAASGRVGISKAAPDYIFDVTSTDAYGLPRGTVAQRPTIVTSTTPFRYNTDSTALEYGESIGTWRQLATRAYARTMKDGNGIYGGSGTVPTGTVAYMNSTSDFRLGRFTGTIFDPLSGSRGNSQGYYNTTQFKVHGLTLSDSSSFKSTGIQSYQWVTLANFVDGLNKYSYAFEAGQTQASLRATMFGAVTRSHYTQLDSTKFSVIEGLTALTSDTLFKINFAGTNNGSLRAYKYGAGNKEAADLSKTVSAYASVYATDGTLLEYPLADLGGSSILDSLPNGSIALDANGNSLNIFNIDELTLGGHSADIKGENSRVLLDDDDIRVTADNTIKLTAQTEILLEGLVGSLQESYHEVTSTTSPDTLSSVYSDNLINQGGTQATFTLVLPPSPVDGQVCTITYVNNITTLTLDGNGTTVIGSAVTTGVPGSQRKYKYYAAAGAWVKIY